MGSRDQLEDTDMADDIATPTTEVPAEATNGTNEGDATPAAGPPQRARPRLDLSALTNPSSRKGPGGERRKGKSIFGVVLGTLNKAKIEDKQRMASEAVSKAFSITCATLSLM